MVWSHTNRKGHAWYLYEGRTKHGKVRYTCKRSKEEGALAELPEGHEVYELPNGQVFVRRCQPKLFTPNELRTVEFALDSLGLAKRTIIECKGKAMIIHYADPPELPDLGIPLPEHLTRKYLEKREAKAIFLPMLKFELLDPVKRTFSASLWCSCGPTDGWTALHSRTQDLFSLAGRFLPSLANDSFYELM